MVAAMKYQSTLGCSHSCLVSFIFHACKISLIYMLSVSFRLTRYVCLSINGVVHHVTLVFSCECCGEVEQRALSFLPAHFSTVGETAGQMPVS